MSQAPASGWLEGREHLLPVRVYYEDTDFTGVVYHGNYARYFERGRSESLRACGVLHTDLLARDPPSAFTVVRLEIDFKRPARIDDALLVRTNYEAVRGPRLIIGQKIVRDGELLAQAKVTAAFIDLSGRPRKPPLALVDALRPLFASETAVSQQALTTLRAKAGKS